jgi:imidazole glycerol-phosphate synthase subunit HisF
MLKKRLVAVITVRDGWAVQSFGYDRYLPLGRPEVLVENLDRWGADEILLQCIDRSTQGLGPDLALLDRVSRLGRATPLIYSGGIARAEDGAAATQAGADRVCLDAALHDRPEEAARLAEIVGAQAVIAALPLRRDGDHALWLDYRTGAETPLPSTLTGALGGGAVSEALVIDWRNDGRPGAHDLALVEAARELPVPLIMFGGLSDPAQMRNLLAHPAVAAVAVGNFLAYGEHTIQRLKQALTDLPLRAATFETTAGAPR